MRLLRPALILLAAALSGCVTFENRLACSLDRSEAYFVSKYGPVGIVSTIEESDAAHACTVPVGKK